MHASIRGLALALVEQPFIETYKGLIITHPFTSSDYVATNTDEGLAFIQCSKEPELVREHFKTLINGMETFEQLLWFTNKPYRLLLLSLAWDYLTEKERPTYLREVWITTEYPNADVNVTIVQSLKLFKSCDKRLLMDKKDYWLYTQSQTEDDDYITVYRGVGAGKEYKPALSWTFDINTAKWFANRFGMGKVYQARIMKKDIVAHFGTRGENEVIVDPFKLESIEEI